MRRFTPLLRVICCGLLFFLAAFTVQAQIIYVTPSGAGNQSGSNWLNAAPNIQLQSKIDGAASGSQVWVAGGTYQPANGTAFSMKENVKIYGGFRGSEATLSQRNLSNAANKSVLKGNGASVVWNSNNGLTNAAVLDGFTITGGTGSPVAFGSNTLIAGGGILLQSVSPVINNCIVNNNYAPIGGAVYSNSSNPIFNNCVFSNNTTAYDNVIFVQGGHDYFNNCTLYGNSGETLIAPNFGDVTVSNCIVWGNSTQHNIYLFSGGSAFVTNSIIQGGYSGNNNLNVDPLFVDAANGNYRLKPNSPAIDKGDNAANSTSADLDGNPRTVNGTIDMGAYEFQCDPTIITAQPQNTSACTGGTATFTVAGTSSSFTYKWYKDGQAVRSGNSSSTLTISNVTAADAGNYTVDIISDCGTITSNAASLTVNAAPSITTSPASAGKCVGEAASFSVTAIGTNLTYQWKKDGADIPGATDAIYSIAAVSTASAGNYSVVVSGICGSPVTSNAANLFVSTTPSITVQPVNVVTCVGVPYTVSVSANGTNIDYEWQISLNGGASWQSISSSNAPSITFSTVTADMSGRLLRVRVYNDCGSVTSDVITLTVNTPPSISTSPASTTKCVGDPVSFSVDATGTNLSYQWKKDGTNITGATSSTYSIASATSDNAGRYSVEVSGSCGSPVTSDAATLTVSSIAKPTITASGATTFCTGGSVTLSAPDGFASYSWSNNAMTKSITVNESGSYSVAVTNSNGCTSPASDAKMVIVSAVPAKPTITASGATTFCSGGSVTLSAPDGFASYSWSNNATTKSITVNESGSYSVAVTNSNGCTSRASDPVTVMVSAVPVKPTITASGATTFCTGGSVTLSAPDGFASYSWSNVATTKSITVNESGSYSVAITNNNGCTSSASDPVTVTVGNDKQNPVITCPAAVTLCYAANEIYTISALQATDNCGIASISYNITGATIRSGNGADASGKFSSGTSAITWTVKDGSGNTSTCQSNITVNDKFTVSIPDGWALGSGCTLNTVYIGYTPASYILLIAKPSGGKSPYTYKWSNGSTASFLLVNPGSATTYSVTVKDAKGCVQTASKPINVVDVRCGSKMDHVTLCYQNKALCADKKDVAGYLLHGAYLGNCKGKTMASKNANEILKEDVTQESDLTLKASPNPSTAYFKLDVISSNVRDKVSISILDEVGRAVETKTATAGQTLQIGDRYRAGVYFAQAIQGNKRVTIKLIKQAW